MFTERWNHRMREGQVESSIARLFQRGATITSQIFMDKSDTKHAISFQALMHSMSNNKWLCMAQ